MSNELMKDIAELRRNMPRNATAMRVCDGLEQLIIANARKAVLTALVNGDRAKATEIAKSVQVFDKKAYQRNYMRTYRAEKRAAS